MGTVCAVERDAYAAQVLAQRQNDGALPAFPIWSDVCSFDGRPWRGLVDVVSGGFPCQDISIAGSGAGLDGERSGLWAEMARIIGEVRPRFVFVENSPMLTARGLGRVLGDLAEMGFDARWGCVSAADVGAPHKRERIWIVAHAHDDRQRKPVQPIVQSGRREATDTWSNGETQSLADADGIRELQRGRQQPEGGRWAGHGSGAAHEVADSDSDSGQGLESGQRESGQQRQAGLHRRAAEFPAWPADPAEALEPRLGRVADGVAYRVDRIKALGNGQVPRVAATAFNLLVGE